MKIAKQRYSHYLIDKVTLFLFYKRRLNFISLDLTLPRPPWVLIASIKSSGE